MCDPDTVLDGERSKPKGTHYEHIGGHRAPNPSRFPNKSKAVQTGPGAVRPRCRRRLFTCSTYTQQPYRLRSSQGEATRTEASQASSRPPEVCACPRYSPTLSVSLLGRALSGPVGCPHAGTVTAPSSEPFQGPVNLQGVAQEDPGGTESYRPCPRWGCKGCRGARRAEHSMSDAQTSLGVLAAWSASFLHLWSGR